MGHGLPIVSTLAGATPDTVTEGADLLVAPDDVDAFAVALRRMLKEARLRSACAEAARNATMQLGDLSDTAKVVSDAGSGATEAAG